jgi:hypothetical protein
MTGFNRIPRALAEVLDKHVGREDALRYVQARQLLSDRQVEEIELHCVACRPCRQALAAVEEDAAIQAESERFLATDEGRAWLEARRSAARAALACGQPPGPFRSAGASGGVNLIQRLLPRFFRGGILAGDAVQRMHEETLAKLAFADVLRRCLSEAQRESIFVESGSTTALAFLAMAEWCRANSSAGVRRRWKVRTNNAFVQHALCNLQGVSVRLLYGNSVLDPKYGGFYPVSAKTIAKAREGKAQEGKAREGQTRARVLVREAWERMLADAARFRQLVMTASRFHLYCGAFVGGSPDNALLKAAFFTGAGAGSGSAAGSRVAILLDGSKLLLNRDLPAEWGNGCIQIITPPLEHRYARLLTRLLGDQARKAAWDSWDLNPVVGCGLHRARFRSRTGEFMEVEAPSSWAECVKNIIERRGGEVSLYVAEPQAVRHDAPFRDVLAEAVREANRCFGNSDGAEGRVRICEPEESSVRVDPQQGVIVDDSRDGVNVAIWKCRYRYDSAAVGYKEASDPDRLVPRP